MCFDGFNGNVKFFSYLCIFQFLESVHCKYLPALLRQFLQSIIDPLLELLFFKTACGFSISSMFQLLQKGPVPVKFLLVPYKIQTAILNRSEKIGFQGGA